MNKVEGTTVSAIMTPDPDVLHVDHTLVEAAARMRDLDVGLMFVVDGDQLVGALTDRDVGPWSASAPRRCVESSMITSLRRAYRLNQASAGSAAVTRYACSPMRATVPSSTTFPSSSHQHRYVTRPTRSL